MTQVAEAPLVLVVHPSLPVNNVKELIALAKSTPKGINAGIATPGSAGHLAAELFKLRTGTTGGIVSVYKSSGATQLRCSPARCSSPSRQSRRPSCRI